MWRTVTIDWELGFADGQPYDDGYGGGFDDAAEREQRAETAADDVIGAVVEKAVACEGHYGVETSLDVDRGVESRLDAALRRGVQNRRGDAAPPADGDNTEASTANDAAYDDSSTESKLETVILDEAPAGARDVVDANTTNTPSEAEPMKVLQSIWDASAVATASRGDLRFMPFSEGVDLSKFVELRTLKGHSHWVRCAASAVLL